MLAHLSGVLRDTLRYFVGLVGIALVYASLCAYDATRASLQSRLQSLWSKIDLLEQGGARRRAAFLEVVAVQTNAALAYLFGKQTISVEAVASSLFLSASAMMVGTGAWFDIVLLRTHWSRVTITSHGSDWPLVVTVGVLAAVVLLLPRLGRYRSKASVIAVGAFILLVVVDNYNSFDNSAPFRPAVLTATAELAAGTLLLLAASVACDLAYILAVRWLLTRPFEGRVLPVLLRLVGVVIVGLGISVLPMVWAWHRLDPFAFERATSSGALLLDLGASNALIGILAFLPIVVSLILLVHALCWYFAAHLLYPVVHDRLVFRRHMAFIAGLAMGSYGIPPVHAIVANAYAFLARYGPPGK